MSTNKTPPSTAADADPPPYNDGNAPQETTGNVDTQPTSFSYASTDDGPHMILAILQILLFAIVALIALSAYVTFFLGLAMAPLYPATWALTASAERINEITGVLDGILASAILIFTTVFVLMAWTIWAVIVGGIAMAVAEGVQHGLHQL